jgi:hypothetical protein
MPSRCDVAIDVFRETRLRQGGSLPSMKTTRQAIVATGSTSRTCFWFACPEAMHLLPVAHPMQRFDAHHGIVMDWTRRSFTSTVPVITISSKHGIPLLGASLRNVSP